MKSILFLAGKYSPKSSANGICCKNIVNECLHRGHHVTCVINADVTRPNVDNVDGVICHRIKPRLYYRINDWCEYNPKSWMVPILQTISHGLNKIQLILMALFWPLVSPIYTYRFYKKGKELIQQQHFDIIVAAYTPIDSLLAGFLLKKRFPNIKFIPYYLDALAGGWGPQSWTKEKTNKYTRRWETMIDKYADLVISMESSKEYHSNYPLMCQHLNRVYLDVPTFMPTQDGTTVSTHPSGSIPTILYAGSIHFPDRNPIPILKAFAEIIKSTPLHVQFAGPINCESLFDEYNKKTNGCIEYIGALNHDDLMRKISEADFTLNLGSTNPNTITAKIFEYISLKKPIISTLPIENEPSIPYLTKYAAAFLFNENAANFNNEVTRLKEFIFSKPSVPNVDYSKIYYKNTPQAFVDLIQQL